MTIIVTGAAGFIGMHVAERLLQSGETVVGIDNFNDYYDPALKTLRAERLAAYPCFRMERLDIADHSAVMDLVRSSGADRVIHLAAQAGVRYSIENPFVYEQSNLAGHLAILEACRHNGVKHLVYASSVVRRAKPAVAVPPITPAETTAGTWTPPRFFTDLGIERLNEINRGVNRAIRPTSDQATFGQNDYWSVPSGPRARGDCEDYVLAKRQALIDAGAPVESLSIAVVETGRREVHAVLLVATADGEVVLDNLTPWIVTWRQTSYRWLQRQAPGSALTWVQPAI